MNKLISIALFVLAVVMSVGASSSFPTIGSGDILQCLSQIDSSGKNINVVPLYFYFENISEDSSEVNFQGTVYDQTSFYDANHARGAFKIIVQKQVPKRVELCSDRFKQSLWLDSICYTYDTTKVNLGICLPLIKSNELYQEGDNFSIKLSHPDYETFGAWFHVGTIGGGFGGGFHGEHCTEYPPYGSGCTSFVTDEAMKIDISSWNPFNFGCLDVPINDGYASRYVDLGITEPVQHERFHFFILEYTGKTTKVKAPTNLMRLNRAQPLKSIQFDILGRAASGSLPGLRIVKMSDGKMVKSMHTNRLR